MLLVDDVLPQLAGSVLAALGDSNKKIVAAASEVSSGKHTCFRVFCIYECVCAYVPECIYVCILEEM